MRCLITGSTGSDGSILAALLEREGHDVYGLVRDQKVQTLPHGTLVRGDLADPASIARVIAEIQPDEVYNLGAFSHAGYSFNEPHYVGIVNGLGAVAVYEAVKRFAPKARVYQASTSEMFGNGPMPANEKTPLAPVSPYGAAKAYAHHMASIYRKMGVWVSCGILFNHVSPKHETQFLPSKLAKVASDIVAGRETHVRLGALHPVRDWGWAEEYVEGMTRILRHNEADDFVLATGEPCTVEAMAVAIFAEFGLNFHECNVRDLTEMRPVELHYLCGDASKAARLLGWQPQVTWKGVALRLAMAYGAPAIARG